METIVRPNNLRAIRKRHGLTQQQVAERLGVAKATVCTAETQGRGLGRKKWYQLADLFDIDPRILEGHLPLPQNFLENS